MRVRRKPANQGAAPTTQLLDANEKGDKFPVPERRPGKVHGPENGKDQGRRDRALMGRGKRTRKTIHLPNQLLKTRRADVTRVR